MRRFVLFFLATIVIPLKSYGQPFVPERGSLIWEGDDLTINFRLSKANVNNLSAYETTEGGERLIHDTGLAFIVRFPNGGVSRPHVVEDTIRNIHLKAGLKVAEDVAVNAFDSHAVNLIDTFSNGKPPNSIVFRVVDNTAIVVVKNAQLLQADLS